MFPQFLAYYNDASNRMRLRCRTFLLILFSDTSFSPSDLSIHMLTPPIRSLNYFTSS